MTRKPWLAVLCGVVALTAAACSSSGGSTGGSTSSSHASKPYTIYLSNNFVGNDWRVQMEKEATVAAGLAPFKGSVKLTITNAGATVPDQIQSLQAIVAKKPDAILVDASSPTALNPTIQQACAKGIVVVNFDQTVTAPCAYKIFSNFTLGEELSAKWMVSQLHGKGNVFEDTGLAGAPISATITSAWNSVLKNYPNIKVIGTYQGQYALGPEQQGVASLIAAHSNVQGILTQGYCTGAMKALQAAGHALVPMLCQSYNQTYVALAQTKGASGFIMANPAWLSVIAMQTAVNVIEGHSAAKTDELTPPCFYQGGSSPSGASCQAIKIGVNAYPDLSPGLTLPVSPSFMKIEPAQVVP
ncbi:MAG TPA: substrate-binding domain-containing protein [Streptosporangiaceae bacterium]|jgi:ribose transport system substrate-binding protein|nr:substrate-binding domain-containing protein [Streptosporangiaceae bacterium]